MFSNEKSCAISQFHEWKKIMHRPTILKMKISCIDHHDGRPICNTKCDLVWLGLSERVVVVDKLLEAPHPSSTPPLYKEEIVQSSRFPSLWVDPTHLVSVICVGVMDGGRLLKKCAHLDDKFLHVLWKVSSLKFELVRKAK